MNLEILSKQSEVGLWEGKSWKNWNLLFRVSIEGWSVHESTRSVSNEVIPKTWQALTFLRWINCDILFGSGCGSWNFKSRSLSESVSCPFGRRSRKWKDSIGLCLILALALNAAKRCDQNSCMPRTLLFYFPDCGQATTDPMNHSLGSLWLLTFHWANHCCEVIGSHWEVKPETSFWLLAVSTAARPLEFPAGDFAVTF